MSTQYSEQLRRIQLTGCVVCEPDDLLSYGVGVPSSDMIQYPMK